jgi:hypothetical protein
MIFSLLASDWTMYAFSTQNQKDYFNLLSVYLDAIELSSDLKGFLGNQIPGFGSNQNSRKSFVLTTQSD